MWLRSIQDVSEATKEGLKNVDELHLVSTEMDELSEKLNSIVKTSRLSQTIE